MEKERKVRAAFDLYRSYFPSEIWHCCKGTCFAEVITVPENFDIVIVLKEIHAASKKLHEEIENVAEFIESRRRGVGGSHIAFVAPSREEREREEERVGTDRQKRARDLSVFVGKYLPYLYGDCKTADGTPALNRKLCAEAICILLGISRRYLFKLPAREHDEEQRELMTSLVDTVGLRQRQHRRNGARRGFPSIEEMPTFQCGCEEPCFATVPVWSLKRQFESFTKASQDFSPRRKEHQHLLDVMFCPLSNSTVKQCNRSIANLFTVSVGRIVNTRRNLEDMCSDPSLEDRPLQANWRRNGYSSSYHPANRLDDDVRERLERHLNMIIREDPAGGSGRNVCRVYSSEINTHEKLRKELILLMKEENNGREERISSSTIQRRINEYLDAKNLRISYTQKDHNACPKCKTLEYASMQYHQQHKKLKLRLRELLRRIADAQEDLLFQESAEALKLEVKTKKAQEDLVLAEMRSHSERDRDIRRTVKRMADHFRGVENELIQQEAFQERSPAWNCRKKHAIITHQDDMTKVNLPYFVQSASADITRWRFDINAHVSAVNDDAVVFSHEQGTGAKNASCICEEIILDHLVRCRGESIKVVVSDNASVGKNWLSTITLPQYIVDQRLADIVLIVFLENNHGKWLADMLFGQLQTRRKRTTLLSADDLLKEFESINRKRGKVQGFALNPLSSIEFSEVFSSLGYQTKPPKDFGFTKRNIHFAGACVTEAKGNLSPALKDLLGPLLPGEPGMVRICSSAPSGKSQHELPYEERFFDVPAARFSDPAFGSAIRRNVRAQGTDELPSQVVEEMQPNDGVLRPGRTAVNGTIGNTGAPLVVPLDLPFASSGNRVVSSRTADHVGFNGYGFRNLLAFPELRNTLSNLVKRAWPVGLVPMDEVRTGFYEPVPRMEAIKCAPENWVMRRPVSHMDSPYTGVKARYPPRNLLNANYKKGPREEDPWTPTATYDEPPFPIIPGTAACSAMKNLARRYDDKRRSVHVLEVLRMIFEDMGRNLATCDEWLQNRATVPSRNAIEQYVSGLNLFIEREKGAPAPAMTVKQAFKKDPDVISEVDRLVRERGIPSTDSKSRTKIFSELFSKAEGRPGGLERQEFAVQRDMERLTRDLEAFMEQQRKFDEDHGLTPVSNPVISNNTRSDVQ